jgi:hypothetical protein
MARLKIAPQRGHAVALAEIMARQAGHDVILVMALPRASLSTEEGALGRHIRQERTATSLNQFGHWNVDCWRREITRS